MFPFTPGGMWLIWVTPGVTMWVMALPVCECVPRARRGQGQFTLGTDAVEGWAKWIWEIGDMKFKLCSQGKWRWCRAICRMWTGQVLAIMADWFGSWPTGCVSQRRKWNTSGTDTNLHGSKCLTQKASTICPHKKYIIFYLVYKLLHTGLQAPDFKLDCDQFVGAHNGVLVVDPSFLQEASVSLLRLKIQQILQGHETPDQKIKKFFLRRKTNLMSLFLSRFCMSVSAKKEDQKSS